MSPINPTSENPIDPGLPPAGSADVAVDSAVAVEEPPAEAPAAPVAEQPAADKPTTFVPRETGDTGGVTDEEIDQFIANILQSIEDRMADGFDLADAAWILNNVLDAIENLKDFEITEDQAKTIALKMFSRAMDAALQHYNEADRYEIKKLAMNMAGLLIETLDLLGLDEAVKESGKNCKDWWKDKFAGCGRRA